MSDTTVAVKDNTLPALLSKADIKKRFEEILGQKAAGFVSSIMSLYNSNKALQECDPRSIVSAAAIAATLDLPINQNLGFAFIIPYKDKGFPVAQFQMGAKGFIQLAIRTGQYKTIHATEVYKDEIERWDQLTGTFVPTDPVTHLMRLKGSDKDLAGYLAFFKMVNGFEKSYYLTIDQLRAHAKKYSKSFENPAGMWMKNPHVMYLKTVTKLLLSKYGMLSIEIQGSVVKAIEVDQGVIDYSTGEITYPDRTEDGDVPSKPSGAEKKINEDQLKLLFARTEKAGINPEEVKDYIRTEFSLEHRKDLNVEQLTQVLKWLEKVKGVAE